MNRFFKNERGITLVALIITIIILIILAAVTISAVFKNNFIGIATQGTENYAEAQVNESKKMDDVAKLLQDTVSNITSITGSNGGGTTPDTPSTPVTLSDADIGKYVNYKPTPGSYWEDTDESGNIKNIDDFAGTAERKDSMKNTQFNTESDLKWRVWSVKDGKLLLVSDVPTTQNLYLSNAIGYNNGVTLLDNICNSCYKNNNYSGIISRSLKIEDLMAIVTIENGQGNYGSAIRSYNFVTPYIWSQHEKGPLDAEGNSTSNVDAINNRSTAYSLTTNTTSDSANISPWIAVWNRNSGMDSTSVYSNAKYKELVTDPASSSYWLSSRCVNIASTCDFGIQIVSSSAISYNYLFYGGTSGSTGGNLGANRVRPLISIPLSSCTITESSANGMDYDISPK